MGLQGELRSGRGRQTGRPPRPVIVHEEPLERVAHSHGHVIVEHHAPAVGPHIFPANLSLDPVYLMTQTRNTILRKPITKLTKKCYHAKIIKKSYRADHCKNAQPHKKSRRANSSSSATCQRVNIAPNPASSKPDFSAFRAAARELSSLCLQPRCTAFSMFVASTVICPGPQACDHESSITN